MKTFTADTLDTAFVILAEADRSGRGHKQFTLDQFRDALTVANQLRQAEGRMRRRAETACNVPMTEAETARADKADAKDSKACADLLAPYRITARFGGDVRGSQVRIMTPRTNRHNTWGGAPDGWAV